MSDSREECPTCGQDWLKPYRSTLDGSEFLLCEECDYVSVGPGHDLDDVFAAQALPPGTVPWDHIEPV